MEEHVEDEGQGTGENGKTSPSDLAEPNDDTVSKWNKEDILGWLAEIGMSSYRAMFVEEHCVTSGDVLLRLTEEHLKEMGMRVVGHRLKVVDALEGLRLQSGLLPQAQFVQMSNFSKEIESLRLRDVLSHFPRRIILIRHAESQGNVDKNLYARIPDANLTITSKGLRQAEEAGRSLKDLIGDESVSFYVSPFIRSQQTYEAIRKSFSDDQVLFVREDPRIREQEWGNFQVPREMPQVMDERRKIGSFYYRFPTGESGADVYDRASIFLDSLYRDMRKGRCGQNTIIVSHGLFCRLFLTRFYHWSVEYFHRMWNFENCQYVVMEYQPDEGYYKLLSKLKVDPA